MIPRPPTYSTARLDSLVCPVFVGSQEIQSCLLDRSLLSLPRLPGVPGGYHPMIVEIWRVQDGLIEVAGLTANNLWEMAGTAAGLGFGGGAGAVLGAGFGSAAGAINGGSIGMPFGPLGWWWGAATGAAAGAAMGAAMMATSGGMTAARCAAEAGRRTSENNSRVIGTYNEIIVTVPCRYAPHGGPCCDVAFVLGTYTDSAASMLGEWLVGWGYRKSPAFGTREGDGALEVAIGSSNSALRIVSRQAESNLPAAGRSAADRVLHALSHPLLGILSPNRLMVSFLDRSFEDHAVRLTPASVRLESGDQFLKGLPGFAADIKPVGNNHPWGAFVVTGLPVTLSYPVFA
jgi:hypothetical protein